MSVGFSRVPDMEASLTRVEMDRSIPTDSAAVSSPGRAAVEGSKDSLLGG